MIFTEYVNVITSWHMVWLGI